jgi:methionyl aminopeptidase
VIRQPTIKTKDQIARMRGAGRILARIMREVSGIVRPGIRTSEIDDAARAATETLGVKSSFIGYGPWGKRPYPAAICVSIDSQVVHGIPGNRKIKDGELVSLDCGVSLDGWHADMAVTVAAGAVSPAKAKLADVCYAALSAGIDAVCPGASLRDIAMAIELASGSRYGIVVGYGGHGIGAALHEPPFVPNCLGQKFDDMRLREGHVLALEPMLNLGSPATCEDKDGWTVVTVDGKPSAHFEHTVAVVEGGHEILTVED